MLPPKIRYIEALDDVHRLGHSAAFFDGYDPEESYDVTLHEVLHQLGLDRLEVHDE